MAMKTYLISSNQANYTDAEFSAIQTLLYSDGVVDNDGLFTGFKVVENAPQNLSVDVNAGNIVINYLKNAVLWKVIVNSPAIENLTIAANNTGSNRVDAIVLHLTQSEPNSLKNNVAELRVITGTGVAALTNAAIDTELGDSNWYRLADVTVPNADTTIEDANISDTRLRISHSDHLQDLYTRKIIESVSGEGVDIQNMIVNDDYVDFQERTKPSNPATNRWKMYFKSSGPYILDDAGAETKIALGGSTIERKAPAAAAANELYENSEDNTLAYKDTGDAHINYGAGGVYGEAITKGDPIGYLGQINKGATQYAPSADTYVDQASPGTNYNAALTLQTSGNGGSTKYSLFKFDNLLTDLGITAADISQLHSFDFMIYRNTAGGANSHECYVITSSWNAATVTFTTVPTFGTQFVNAVATAATGYITFTTNSSLNYSVSKQLLDNGFVLKMNLNPVHTWSGLGAANPPYITNLVYTGSDGKLHKVNATSGSLLRGFMGIAPKNGVLNDTHPIIVPESIYHTAGLTQGETYYVNDAGAISITPGTFAKEIGVAITPTQLLIKDGPCLLGSQSASPAGALPQVVNIAVPKGCNMIIVQAQTPVETSRSINANLVVLKGNTGMQMQRSDSGATTFTTINWSGSNAQITFTGTGSPSSGGATLYFYKI